jgi:hypothetical protein
MKDTDKKDNLNNLALSEDDYISKEIFQFKKIDFNLIRQSK